MNVLDALQDGVTELPTIHGAAVRLLHNVAAQIRAVATNPAACEQLADLVDREADRLSGHVLANTPVISATPPVHPDPDDDAEDEDPAPAADNQNGSGTEGGTAA